MAKFQYSWLAVVSIVAVSSASVFAQSGNYHPIPPGFDFPGDENVLLKDVENKDVPAMRAHAWLVFAGMTQPAHPENPNSEAIWETWYRGSEVFPVGPQLQGEHELSREFVTPRQFLGKPGPKLQDVGISLASFTLFNQDLVRPNN